MQVIGLKNCDTCRKAAKALLAAGVSAEIRDIRTSPLTGEEIARFLETFGTRLINTRSTTWRGLDEAEKSLQPAELLAAFPTVMKRPIIDTGRALYLGWTSEVQAALT